MSVGYSMEYSVIIHGSRADFEQIPAIAQKVSDDYARYKALMDAVPANEL